MLCREFPRCNVVFGLITPAVEIREYVAANGGQPLPCGVGGCAVKLTWLSNIHKVGITDGDCQRAPGADFLDHA